MTRKTLRDQVMEMPLDAMSELSDDVLLAFYSKGDKLAARALTYRLTPMVFSLAFRLLGDRAEAEDVSQEALLRLWKIAPDWQPGKAKVTTWLYRIVCNLCTDRHRRRRGVCLDEIAEPKDPAPGVELKLQEKDRAKALGSALESLPDRQRQAVVLRHIEGMANPEIAQVLEISIEAVESLISRGKRHLKEKLRDQKKPLGLEE